MGNQRETIAILGAGNVGKTLGRRWAEAGYVVHYGVRNPADPKYSELNAVTIPEAAQSASVILLSVPYPAAEETIQSAGDLTGKVVIDATNPIRPDFSGLSIGTTTSAGEAVAGWARGAHVVKAFNTIGANIMADPSFGDAAATLLIAGNDALAKSRVSSIASDIGFAPVDAGPLEQARWLEAQAWLWISMAMKYGQGRDIVFQLLRR